MKVISKSIFAVSLALCALSCNSYKYESVEGDPTGARIYTLDNGLKIYTIVNKDKPRIDAQIAVKVGSKNDPRETTGLAHYFEHLMFKGTQKVGTQNYAQEEPLLDSIEALFETYRQTEDEAIRKDIYHQIDSISYEASKISIPNEYDKLMAAIGASGTNAYTSYDVTCYVENIPSNQIDLWAKIQADRFQNCVLRGFHTELETIYEEYNMYAAQDQSKEFNALFEGLFPTHPYNTDVIGLPSHLKNPSITNVKKYHDEWYVPNNMAVVLSGDFDPDKAVKTVAKYFGTMQPNKDLKRPVFQPEQPIEQPVVKEVLGNESPSILLAWRFPGAADAQSIKLDLVSKILYNGAAGLIDLDVNQEQKTLGLFAAVESLADYSAFLVMGEPKKGQSLEQVKDIFFEELSKLKAGDFDEELLKAIVNNEKLRFMKSIENTRSMARTAVNCFINDESWEDAVVKYTENLGKISKEDIVEFANEYLCDNNYVQVNKLQAKDPANVSIPKPKITPIFTNRDTSSAFLRSVQAEAAAVSPIEPVFLDYDKDMAILKAKSDIEVLYKKNESNGLFELGYVFEMGTDADKTLDIATSYVDYLGTSTLSAAQIKQAFYSIACNCNIYSTPTRTYVNISGLAENMNEAVSLAEGLIADAQPDEAALSLLKANILQERANAKADQRSNYARLCAYGLYGAQNPYTNVLSDKELKAISGEQLIAVLKDLFTRRHSVTYYGPLSGQEAVEAINALHAAPEALADVKPNKVFPYQKAGREVVVAPYDANQLQLFSVSNTGEKYDHAAVAAVRMYNEYFGGGMNSIVFQEMREARGLAYSASARYELPGDPDHEAVFTDRIYTQNDKLIDALDAFDGIINEMPVSQNAFDIAKESIISNIRTQRTTKSRVLTSFLNARKLGLTFDINRDVFEKVQGFTLQDVVDFQQKNVKGMDLRIMILGRESELDYASLKQYGPVRHVSTKEIFGY